MNVWKNEWMKEKTRLKRLSLNLVKIKHLQMVDNEWISDLRPKFILSATMLCCIQEGT